MVSGDRSRGSRGIVLVLISYVGAVLIRGNQVRRLGGDDIILMMTMVMIIINDKIQIKIHIIIDDYC